MLSQQTKKETESIGGQPKYRDEDYVEKEVIKRNKIEILEEHGMDGYDGNCDFRDNPEDAPYRIVATKLLDGRLVVLRTSVIGRVYSAADLRRGNYFSHFLIFPKGTEIEDLKGLDLPFIKGLKPGTFASEKHPEWKRQEFSIPQIRVSDLKSKVDGTAKMQTAQQTYTTQQMHTQQPYANKSNSATKNLPTQQVKLKNGPFDNLPPVFQQEYKLRQWGKQLDELEKMPKEEKTSLEEDKIDELRGKIDKFYSSIEETINKMEVKQIFDLLQLSGNEKKLRQLDLLPEMIKIYGKEYVENEQQDAFCTDFARGDEEYDALSSLESKAIFSLLKRKRGLTLTCNDYSNGATPENRSKAREDLKMIEQIVDEHVKNSSFQVLRDLKSECELEELDVRNSGNEKTLEGYAYIRELKSLSEKVEEKYEKKRNK